ncbi:hypothetical protein NAD41_002345 [Salmonella enterica]|nr:hypothetical protein [Salmonella enterica]EKK6596313.1 hypothetical protein [Salmonella enterica]
MMLNLEQITHFQDALTRAKKIVISQADDKSPNKAIAYHIRISGRQNAAGEWNLGFIFGTKGNEDWLYITTVEEAKLRKAKEVYRAMLHDLLHTK